MGSKTPAEAKEKIEEQRREFAHITEPANLEEQALKLCGKDIYRCLIKGIQRNNGAGRPPNYLHSSSDVSLSALYMIIIISTMLIRASPKADTMY